MPDTQKKKILYVITKGNFGGAQRYVFDLATHLPKDQFEGVVAFGEGKTLGEKLTSAGIRTISISSLKRDIGIFSDIRAFFSLLSIIKKEKPHVVHLNSSKVGVLGVLVVRLLNLFKLNPNTPKPKAIFTGHGWAFNEERSLFTKLIFYKLYWLIIMLSHSTIAVSERTKDQVAWMPFLKKKVRVIRNGIESFDLLPKPDARKILAPQLTERTWIGTISELHKSKGLDYLLRAFQNIPEKFANVALVVIGAGDEEENLKSLAHDLNLEHKVLFTGFIPDAKQYLSAFDIFTLTSRTEALPYAPLEAGLANLPVIASWVGGIPEIITNEESGLLIDPTNAEKLSSVLERLIVDDVTRNSLGKSLHDEVLKSYSLTQMIQETTSLY